MEPIQVATKMPPSVSALLTQVMQAGSVSAVSADTNEATVDTSKLTNIDQVHILGHREEEIDGHSSIHTLMGLVLAQRPSL